MSMAKTGFKPKQTARHTDYARQFEKYLEKKPKDDVVDHPTFIRWIYDVKQ